MSYIQLKIAISILFTLKAILSVMCIIIKSFMSFSVGVKIENYTTKYMQEIWRANIM